MAEKKKPIVEDRTEVLVRILGQDINGNKKVRVGLTKIKGVSWSISNFLCKKLDIDKNLKIGELGKEGITRVETELKGLSAPEFLKNRRKDFDAGKSTHLFATNLDMRREFDIKRLKQIKSYRGLRHSLKLPVRGQRTRSHFRTSGLAVGVKKPKTGKKG